MKAGFFTLIYIVILICSVCETAYSQCADPDAVEIPVVFEFRNAESKADWIYDSLTPRLPLLNEHVYRARNAVNKDGRLEAKFCVLANDIPPQNSKIYFLFGIRKLEASVRPTRGGMMPTIMFLNQPDPDWLIIRQPTWSLNKEKYPRLEVELFNFANATHPGVNLTFRFERHSPILCYPSPPGFATVPVSIYIEKGKVKVASGDPQSPELIIRQASVVKECGTLTFKGELGPSGAVQGKSALRIRYAFMQRASPIRFKYGRDIDGSTRKPVLSSLTVSDLFTLPTHREIEVIGERVFPINIEVKD